MSLTRSERLIGLSQMIVDNNITYKLEFICTIKIYGKDYFNVYRRYNSPYSFIIEDMNGDIFLHQDYTIRKSIQDIVCLSDDKTTHIYTLDATSYKHNGPVPNMSYDIVDMTWSEIHAAYHALNLNIGGLLHEFHNVYNVRIRKLHDFNNYLMKF